MKVEVLRNVEPNFWDGLCLQMQGNIFQSWPWIAAMEKNGLSPVFFVARKNSLVMGAMALSVRNYRIPLLCRCRIGIVPSLTGMGRPLLRDGNGDVFTAIMRSVDEYAGKLKAVSLTWPTDFTLFDETGSLENCGFQVIPFGTSRLDLAMGMDALWEKLYKHKKRSINKARKNNVCIRHSDEVDDYIKLHAHIARKLNYPVESVAVRIRNIYHFLKGKGYCRIFIAYDGTKAVSGAFIIMYGDTAYYLYGASVKDDKSRSSHLLHWTIAQWVCENGFRFYDFLGIVPDDRAGADIRGVNRFKQEFNGEFCPRYGAVKVYDRRKMWLIEKLSRFKKAFRKLI